MNNSRMVAMVVALVILVFGFVALVAWQLGLFRRTNDWTVSTGREGGTYHRLGEALAESLGRDKSLKDLERFSTKDSAGSDENMARLESGEAHFALVQSDAGFHPGVRLLAPLYEEILHILVSRDFAKKIDDGDLLGVAGEIEKISLGPEGSGTREAAKKLLRHFGHRFANPLALAPDALTESFRRGELDVAFVLAGPGSAIVTSILDSGSARLVGLGDGPDGGTSADAFATLHPAYRATIVPERLYGSEPTSAVRSVSVTALLVASEKVDPDVARAVTSRVFGSRYALAKASGTPLDQVDESEITSFPASLHPGAQAFYFREKPSFFVEYAEAISLGITLMVGIWSVASLFLRWTANLKKERIDRYFLKIQKVREFDPDERLGALRKIQEEALDELLDERVSADSSFVIFHDYLVDQIKQARLDASNPS